MKWAWIEDDRIRDIAPGEPADWYHPDVAVFYDTEVPDDAENGDTWVDGVLTKRPIPEFEAVPPPPRAWDVTAVRDGLSLAEKVIWDTDGKPEVITAKLELANSLNHDAVKEILDFLVAAKVISQESEDRILA